MPVRGEFSFKSHLFNMLKQDKSCYQLNGSVIRYFYKAQLSEGECNVFWFVSTSMLRFTQLEFNSKYSP